jgi:oligopeptide transport system ATP-binding protein
MYPHEFSGGMRQRAMIAMALLCEPKLLIADEPTTALDVTVQAQILELIAGLGRRMNMATVLITHDLGVIAGLSDRVAVMYGGRVVEEAAVNELFKNPQHPYSKGLLQSMPRLDTCSHTPLHAIAGQPPDLQSLPPGCSFEPRCAHAFERCRTEIPQLRPAGDKRFKACHLEKME